MFGRTYVVPGPRSVSHHHTVTEKRAPTDESVRLLREMESAAEAQVLEAIRLTDNGFECVVHAMRDGPTDDTVLRAIFSLNGKRLTADARGWDKRAPELVEMLIDAIAAKVATEIVRPAIKAAAPALSRLR